MRLLIYGMQSSGASTGTLILAQKPGSVAFIDIWSMYAAPALTTEVDVIAKAVVTTAFPLELHKRRLRPDKTILFLRHPVDTYNSLVTKGYANDDGLIDEKFMVLEGVFGRPETYDRIAYYEDLVFSPGRFISLAAELGWALADDRLDITRRHAEIVAFNEQQIPGIGGQLKYGSGNHSPGLPSISQLKFKRALDPSRAKLRSLCPRLLAHYDEVIAARATEWEVPEPPILAYDISHLVTRLCVNPSRALLDRYRMVASGGALVKGVTSNHLVVSGSGDGTITISGLPGAPFNRLTGTVSLHQKTGRTRITVDLLDSSATAVGHHIFELSRGDRRLVRIDVPDAPGPFDLRLGTQPLDAVAGVPHFEVVWSELRMEHA